MSFLPQIDNLVHAMANVPQRVYRLPLPQGIKFNVLQPGDKRHPHAERIKVFKGSPETGPNFSIMLRDFRVVGDVFLNSSELKMIVEHVKKYQHAYLKMWYDDGMDIDDLRTEMDAIDRKEP
jgi:hypothetical protein